MQTGVLIMAEAYAMFGAGCSRQERGSRAAVQVINNVIARGAQFPRQARPGRLAVARDCDHAIDKV